jgi:acyl-CoA synthetase (AMP-forming)/AMP-acid ligase II
VCDQFEEEGMGVHDFTVYSVIKRSAILYRDRTALICGDQRITYQEYLTRVDRVSDGLRADGVEKGDRIAILALNSAEFLYLYGAAARIGAIVLPINWRLKPEEIAYILSDASPRVIFTDNEFQAMTAPLIARLDFIEKSYSMGQAQEGFAAFGELLDKKAEFPEIEVHSDDPYVIIHTAAVQGKSRGAVMSHGSLLQANLQIVALWNITPEDCNLGMLPIFHVSGLGFWLMLTHAGGTNIILPRFDPDQALKCIQENKVTMFAEFPPMLTTMLDRNKELQYDLSSLRHAGGMDGPDTVKRFQAECGATFWAAFGQSETSGMVTLAPYFERPASAGQPCLMSEVKIVDEYGNFAETGKTGEIVVRGPAVFKGYWNLEKETEHTFRRGWHHTGDMGRFDEDGYLYYAGRMPEKELIKPGGENVYPAEVEKAILEHPLVEEAVVFGVPDEQWGEAIKAVCVLRKGESLETSELIEFVASRIARFKKPKHVVFVAVLPKMEDGSVHRAEVKAKYSESST